MGPERTPKLAGKAASHYFCLPAPWLRIWRRLILHFQQRHTFTSAQLYDAAFLAQPSPVSPHLCFGVGIKLFRRGSSLRSVSIISIFGFQFENLKSDQINCGCLSDNIGFQCAKVSAQKNDKISQIDRSQYRPDSFNLQQINLRAGSNSANKVVTSCLRTNVWLSSNVQATV